MVYQADKEHLFDNILDRDEQILWTGAPNFTTFMCGGIPFLIFGMIWGVFEIAFLIFASFGFSEVGVSSWAYIPFLLFMLLHSFPCWGSVLYMFWLYFSHANTAYAITNKRVLFRSGVFGIDYQIIDYDKIKDVQVNVGPIEKMFDVGSILFNTGDSHSNGYPMLKRFSGIENPYDVFRQLKEVSLDVKTDWNYPNAKRPETNPGYRTHYQQGKE